MQQITGARNAWKLDIGPMTALAPGSKSLFAIVCWPIFSDLIILLISFIDFFYRYVQRDSRTTVMKRKTETPKEDAKKAKKDDSSSGKSDLILHPSLSHIN